KIALPSRAAASTRSAWVSVELAITTASIVGSASAAAWVPTTAPCRPASRAAAAWSVSTITESRAAGWAAILAAWIAPMRPAPNWQNLSIRDVLFSARTLTPCRGDRQDDHDASDDGPGPGALSRGADERDRRPGSAALR